MNFLIDKDVKTYYQIQGYGEIVSTIYLIINVAQLESMKDVQQFMVSLQIIANKNTYYYSNTYSKEDIKPNGDIEIGGINILGEVDEKDLVTTAKIIYLESPSY